MNVKIFNYQILDPDPNSPQNMDPDLDSMTVDQQRYIFYHQEFSCHKTLSSRSCRYTGSFLRKMGERRLLHKIWSSDDIKTFLSFGSKGDKRKIKDCSVTDGNEKKSEFSLYLKKTNKSGERNRDKAIFLSGIFPCF